VTAREGLPDLAGTPAARALPRLPTLDTAPAAMGPDSGPTSTRRQDRSNSPRHVSEKFLARLNW